MKKLLVTLMMLAAVAVFTSGYTAQVSNTAKVNIAGPENAELGYTALAVVTANGTIDSHLGFRLYNRFSRDAIVSITAAVSPSEGLIVTMPPPGILLVTAGGTSDVILDYQGSQPGTYNVDYAITADMSGPPGGSDAHVDLLVPDVSVIVSP